MLNKLLLSLLFPVFYMADSSSGGGGGDTANGGGGDTANGGGGGDTSKGGNDTATGGGGDDDDGTILEELAGGGGNDTSKGGAGDSTLKGGGGNDTMSAEQKAAAATLAEAEKDSRRPKDVPAKYWDTKKGEVNYAAWAKSTGELESRMRAVGLPPKTADEYKFEVPKELKAQGIDLDPKQSKAFREKALAAGVTQKQFEVMMGAYFENIRQAADQVSHFSKSAARAELLAHYKTPEATQKAARAAFQVFKAFASEEDMKQLDKVGNIPVVVRILANIAAEMGEDPGVLTESILDRESLQTLMRGGPGKEDSPYWNASDPRHAETVRKVTAHHEAAAAAARRQAG